VDDERSVRWLHRRVGWGLPPAELDKAIAAGPQRELERMLAPPSALGELWDNAKLPLERQNPEARTYAIDGWLDGLVNTATPLVDRIAWTWHGHLVSGLDKVRVGRLMVDQIRLFRSDGMGSFAALLRAITIDPAMMWYLDLQQSTKAAPNENYSRELLELFALGEGNYTEADVMAGAKALSGWKLTKEYAAEFVERRHDPTPQTYLGATGVSDLDGVIDAVMTHPALPGFIAKTFAADLLGVTDDDLVQSLANQFADSGYDIRTLVAATLNAGLGGAAAPQILSPVQWLVTAIRVTGAQVAAKARHQSLRNAGHLPMMPPNVAGWPGGLAWLGASSLVGRTSVARLIAQGTAADSAVMVAAASDDTDELADALGLLGPFSPATSDALKKAANPADRLTAALISPEFIIAEELS
jgi:uncharacterized protein (DUF1800 family)